MGNILKYKGEKSIRMMYPYMTLFDDTEVSHSQIIQEDGKKTIQVHFERPTESGFDSARCILPSYTWMYNKGYSEEEIRFFEEFLQHNSHLLYRYAESGGLNIA